MDREGWDLDVEDELFGDSGDQLLEEDAVLLVRVLLPLVTVGLDDLDVLEILVVRLQLDCELDLLREDGEESSEGVDEHLIDLVEDLDEVEPTVSELGDPVHQLRIVVVSEPVAVDRKGVLDLVLLEELLDARLGSGVLPVAQEEDTCDVILEFSLLDGLEREIHPLRDISASAGDERLDFLVDFALVFFVEAPEWDNPVRITFESDQTDPVVLVQEITELFQGVLDELDLLSLHRAGDIYHANQINARSVTQPVVGAYVFDGFDLGLDWENLGFLAGQLDRLGQTLEADLDAFFQLSEWLLLDIFQFGLGFLLFVHESFVVREILDLLRGFNLLD